VSILSFLARHFMNRQASRRSFALLSVIEKSLSILSFILALKGSLKGSPAVGVHIELLGTPFYEPTALKGSPAVGVHIELLGMPFYEPTGQ
jgi:hypothetical protein